MNLPPFITMPGTTPQRSLLLFALLFCCTTGLPAEDAVNESARMIPLAYEVDVVVVGGSTGAVAAAVAAADSGAKVFLAAERPYLGDDMTATLRLWPAAEDELDAPLTRQLFADPRNHRSYLAETTTACQGRPDCPPPRPMHVKKTLDDALLQAGVRYLYSCFATDVLRDAEGRPRGIVMANRAGRQAVVAKVIIDATQRAIVARMAGAAFRPYPAGPQTMKYVVIGGQPHSGKGFTARIAAPSYRGPSGNEATTTSDEFQVIEYAIEVPMAGDTDPAWANAEQLVRSMTYDSEQRFTADALYQVPPDPMHARRADAGPWRGSQEVSLDSLRPAGVADLYVLGARADVSRAAAERLLLPGTLIALGTRVGEAAARDAANRTAPSRVSLPGTPTHQPVADGDVREILAGVRPSHAARSTVPQAARSLPVLGRYDVVVVGGGTSGAPAGIASARQGAKTLVVEQYHGLGGMGTLGGVANYFFGNRTGFTATVGGGDRWDVEQKMQWWRDELLKAGGDLWFGCVGCGALVNDGRVRGVVVATPRGRGVVLAKAVVDTTGSADIAAAAGSPCVYTDHRDFAVMGAGVPPRNLVATGSGADFCIVDETDMVDAWHVYVYAKAKYPRAFDQAPILTSRERRRVVGDYTLTILDQLNARTYPDTICVASSTFDQGVAECHTLDPALLAVDCPGELQVNVPYRCCLPNGLDGIFVAALGLSAHHDALPMIRMQPDLQNLGYAVGVAAAMTARSGAPTREIDLRALQRHLVEIGNVPPSVLTDGDSFPFSAERLAAAMREVPGNPRSATVILAQPRQAIPLLQAAYAGSGGSERLAYSKLLGILGDPLGVDPLIASVRGFARWDPGWNFRSKFGPADARPLLSPLDRLIIILGRAGDRRAVPAIIEKLRLLTADHDFSHHRAVALALESLGDRAAAEPLAGLLGKPGMSGHVHSSIEVALQRETLGGPESAVRSRREALRELMLARALYHCGDWEGIGEKTLRLCAEDLRGHLARHARAVLDVHQANRQ